MTTDTDVAIIGGGAAGLATAIFLRRLNDGVRVSVFDGARRLGAKILVSGGGRCNVTNTVVTERDFWGGRRSVIRRVLRALPVAATVDFFAEIGVPLREEADGKLFPISNRARDVLEALLGELARCGARLEAPARVTEVRRCASDFRLSCDGGNVHASRVVLATGGQSLPKTGSDGGGYAIAAALGHTIVPTTPALAPLVLAATDAASEASHRLLSGVSHDVELTIWIDGAVSERLAGGLLWTHFGVSGPVVLNASRHWHRGVLEGRPTAVTVNFLGKGTFDEAERRLLTLAAVRPRASIHSALSALVPAAVGAGLLHASTLRQDTPLASLARDDRRWLSHALTEWPLAIAASRGYNFAEATAGGVHLDEIHASTMESRVCPGLFLTGEILDVDGRIGGFNFQWAWASARAAAQALARESHTRQTSNSNRS